VRTLGSGESRVARLGGQPVVPFGQPVSLGDPPAAAFAALGRAYITCLRDRAIPPAMQRRMFEAAGCDPVIEIDTDHALWVSRTDELVEALDRLGSDWINDRLDQLHLGQLPALEQVASPG
jgi:hypothetical protein